MGCLVKIETFDERIVRKFLIFPRCLPLETPYGRSIVYEWRWLRFSNVRYVRSYGEWRLSDFKPISWADCVIIAP